MKRLSRLFVLLAALSLPAISYAAGEPAGCACPCGDCAHCTHADCPYCAKHKK